MIGVEAKLPQLRINRLQNSGAGIRTKPDTTATKLLFNDSIYSLTLVSINNFFFYRNKQH